MGNTVKKAVVAIGKTIAKGATSAVGNMIPVIGKPLADHINSLYAEGGLANNLAGASAPIPPGFKPKVINTPQQLLDLVKKVPQVAEKSGLTVEKIQEAMDKAKSGEVVVAKRRGGRAKKTKAPKAPKEDRVMLESGSAPAYARGGLVPSVF